MKTLKQGEKNLKKDGWRLSASLTMVAQNILPVDVDHSFRYLRIAQEDALLYNAKLRPWQISRFLMEVEDAYSHLQMRQNKASMASSILLAILVLVLALITHFLIARSRKLTRIQGALPLIRLLSVQLLSVRQLCNLSPTSTIINQKRGCRTKRKEKTCACAASS